MIDYFLILADTDLTTYSLLKIVLGVFGTLGASVAPIIRWVYSELQQCKLQHEQALMQAEKLKTTITGLEAEISSLRRELKAAFELTTKLAQRGFTETSEGGGK